MRREGQKRDILSNTLFNGPYWLPHWYWSVSFNFIKWIINFARRKSFWTKIFSWTDSFLVHAEVLICYSIFFKIAFILIELHLFGAYSIGNDTLLDYQRAGKMALNQKGIGKKSREGYAFTKEGTFLKKERRGWKNQRKRRVCLYTAKADEHLRVHLC